MREPKKTLFNEIWAYYKKWINNNDTDEEWDVIIAEANEIIKKHNDDKFARELIYAVHNEISNKK